MTIEDCLEKHGTLQPYKVVNLNLEIDKVREMFGNVPDKKYSIYTLFSDTDSHDIYGNTGKPEMIVLAVRDRITDHYKYIGNIDYNADTIREYLIKYYNKDGR